MSVQVMVFRITAPPHLLVEYALPEERQPPPACTVTVSDLTAFPLGSIESRAAALVMAETAADGQREVIGELKVDVTDWPEERARAFLAKMAGLAKRRAVAER